MDVFLIIMRVAFVVMAILALGEPLITGKIRVRGGKWVITKSMPQNPIIRSQRPLDFWFVWGLGAFIFTMVLLALFCR